MKFKLKFIIPLRVFDIDEPRRSCIIGLKRKSLKVPFGNLKGIYSKGYYTDFYINLWFFKIIRNEKKIRFNFVKFFRRGDTEGSLIGSSIIGYGNKDYAYRFYLNLWFIEMYLWKFKKSMV